MRRKFLSFLICVLVVAGTLACAPMLRAQAAADQSLISDDGIEAVTLELKGGERAIVYILKENKDTLYVRNLNDSMEVSLPRANVVKIRKPTAEEIQKTKKRLGMMAPPAPAQQAAK